MSLHEQFIPGRWVDDIDVNDFLKLNKKPFLDKPNFLINPSSNSNFLDLSNWLEEDKTVDLNFANFQSEDVNWFPLSMQSLPMKRKIGYSENMNEIRNYYVSTTDAERITSRETVHEVFQEIAVSDMNKSFRIGLFQQHPYNYTPMFIFPDIRIVPLYGTKQIIKEKRHFLLKLEKYLQTTDWIQQRMAKQKEITALKDFEKFAKSLGVNVTKPAESTKEVIDVLYVTLLSVVIENPSINFSLTDILTFIDIFAEKELQLKRITEEEIQNWLDELFVKLSKIRFTHSPNFDSSFPHSPFIFGETIGETITKTTYRFLSSLERFYTSPFVLRIFWSEKLPIDFKEYIFSLYKKNVPLSIVSPRLVQEMKNPILLPFGMHAEIFDEIAFHGGGCDLEKAFYLAINGGKEIESNTNLSAITSPLRQNQISYEEVLDKVQDFLSYTILSYTEIMNAIMYINDIHHNHPFRTSLISNQPFLSVQFGFFNLKPIVNMLAAIKENDFEIEKKSQKWITKINANQEKYAGEEMIMTHLASFVLRELGKIPLYKEAKKSVRFYLHTMYNTSSKENIDYDLTLPPEYIKGNFHANVVGVELTDAFIKNAFSKNITELNVSKEQEFYLANGVIFHQNYDLKK